MDTRRASSDRTDVSDQVDGTANTGVDGDRALLDLLSNGSSVAETRVLDRYRQGTTDVRVRIVDSLAIRAAGDCPYALAALLAIVDEHRLTRSALASVGVGPVDQPDVDQAVLIAVARSIHQFRGESRFTTWLYTMARNVSVSETRRFKPTVDFEEVNADQHLPRRAAPRRISSLVAEDDLIEAVIGKLPEAFRNTVYLRDVERLTYRQIAERQGLAINTVKSRLARGRLLLADIWADQTQRPAIGDPGLVVPR